MELNERQQRVLRGEICPYCGRETELVNADKIYSRKGLGMVMMCKPCSYRPACGAISEIS